MKKLKISRVDVPTVELSITPSAEYGFELYAKMGFHKAFREREMQSDLFYLSWLLIRDSGETVDMFGPSFIATLVEIEVLDDSPLE